MAARSSTPLRLYLLPDLVDVFPARAASLGLNPSALLAILVWNDERRPQRMLRALEQSPKLVREQISCSLRSARMAAARRRAREQQLSVNAYLEALISGHLRAGRGPLVVLAARETRGGKPR